jgi:hypothetical protein
MMMQKYNLAASVRATQALMELKKEGKLPEWISLRQVNPSQFKGASWRDIATLASITWQYWSKEKKKRARVAPIYESIKKATGADVRVIIKSSKKEAPKLAYRIWLLSTTKDKRLKKRRLKKWGEIYLKFVIKRAQLKTQKD